MSRFSHFVSDDRFAVITPVAPHFRGDRARRTSVVIASTTGPLEALENRDVLVIADAQNINSSAYNAGYRVDWKKTSDILRQASRSISFHAVFSDFSNSSSRAKHFSEAGGWVPHVKAKRTVRNHRGIETTSNADNCVAFTAGMLVSRSSATLILVCSGDGELVEDVSESIHNLPRQRQIATLSMAGSTAQRLNAQHSELIDWNLELGLDCLVALRNSHTRNDFAFARSNDLSSRGKPCS